MSYCIRKAVQEDEQRIFELFIEMIQTIYHTEDVQGYEPGYLDRYWKMERIFFFMWTRITLQRFVYMKDLDIKFSEMMETDT